jgi:hypothetical protein
MFLITLHILTQIKQSMYGTNFFVFNEKTRKIVIGKDFWVFILTWLPLTLLTGLVYAAVVAADARRKGKPVQWLWARKRARATPKAG